MCVLSASCPGPIDGGGGGGGGYLAEKREGEKPFII